MDGLPGSLLPVSTTILTSAPTCSRKGEPAFTVTTTNECITSRPIWALVYTFPYQCAGIQIRDPTRKIKLGIGLESNRRIGPESTLMRDEGPDTPDIERTELVRLEPGLSFNMTYTFSVIPKLNGIRGSDVRMFVVGNSYILTLRKQKWWWKFEDDMPEDCTEDERREILSLQPVTSWRPECSTTFEVTE